MKKQKQINKDVEQLVKKKTKRKIWKSIEPRNPGEVLGFVPAPKYLACIDPNTYKLVRFFESVLEMQHDTNIKNLQPILYRYLRNTHGKNGTATIGNWIVVEFMKEEMEDKTLEEFESMIFNKAIDKILFVQMQRVRENINTFTTEEKKKIFRFLNNVESPNPKAIDDEV